MTIVDLKEIKWITPTKTTSVDKLGKLFSYEGQIYRAIKEEKVSYVKLLFNKGIIDKLINKGFLINTKISDLIVEGYDIVLWQENIIFQTKPFSWTLSQLRDAALLYIDINIELLNYGLGLSNGYRENIVQNNNGKLVWIDFCSILPLVEIGNGYDGMVQFKKSIMFFLYLLTKGEEFKKIYTNLIHTIQLLEDDEFKELSGGGEIKFDNNNRRTLLTFAKQWILDLKFSEKETKWINYHKLIKHDIDITTPNTNRAKIIKNLINISKPKTGIDIGCNEGIYTVMLAKTGCKTYAFDIDEWSLERLYAYQKMNNYKYPIVIAHHSLYSAYDDYDWTEKASDVYGDLVIALAVTNHLSITFDMPLKFITERIVSYCKKDLLTDFMPYGLGHTNYKPDPLPDFYKLENYIYELEKYFKNIYIYYYPVEKTASFRILIYCRNYEEKSSTCEIKKIIYNFNDKYTKENSIIRLNCSSCGHLYIYDGDTACPKCSFDDVYDIKKLE